MNITEAILVDPKQSHVKISDFTFDLDRDSNSQYRCGCGTKVTIKCKVIHEGHVFCVRCGTELQGEVAK